VILPAAGWHALRAGGSLRPGSSPFLTPAEVRMSSSHSTLGSGRRQFLKTVGWVTLSGALGAPMALAQSSGKQPAAKKPGPKPQPAAPPASEPPPISDEAKALGGIVHQRYGAHLSADQLSAVTRELENRVQSGKRLRAVPLANADEPDTTFHA
jgi:hypothetical protein